MSSVASISRIIKLPINRELSRTFADFWQDFSEAISTSRALFLVNKVTLSFSNLLHLDLRSANSCERMSTSFSTSKVRVCTLALVLFQSCAIVLHSWQGNTPAHSSWDSRRHLMWNHFPQMQQRIGSPPPRVRWRQPDIHRSDVALPGTAGEEGSDEDLTEVWFVGPCSSLSIPELGGSACKGDDVGRFSVDTYSRSVSHLSHNISFVAVHHSWCLDISHIESYR